MLTLDFINVGYGDAILIRDESVEFYMLVDCGDISVGNGGLESSRISAADFLKRENISHLSLLVLTHLHRDHSGGLTQILEQVSVGEFWTNYLPPENYWGTNIGVPNAFSPGSRCLLQSMNIYLNALKNIEEQSTKIRLLEEDSKLYSLTRNLFTDIHLEDRILRNRQDKIWERVLQGSFNENDLEELDGFINNTSIRLRLCWKNITIELPGDACAEYWGRHRLFPSTIIKLPHHGHNDSMNHHVLNMLKPQNTVVSVSNSRKDDCPSAEILHMIKESGSNLFITDSLQQDGVVYPGHSSVRFSFS